METRVAHVHARYERIEPGPVGRSRRVRSDPEAKMARCQYAMGRETFKRKFLFSFKCKMKKKTCT